MSCTINDTQEGRVMSSRDFCFWLQGFFELRKVGLPQMSGTPLPVGAISAEQAELIERHLALVFTHEIDPSAGGADIQAKLNAVHAGGKDVKYRC